MVSKFFECTEGHPAYTNFLSKYKKDAIEASTQ